MNKEVVWRRSRKTLQRSSDLAAAVVLSVLIDNFHMPYKEVPWTLPVCNILDIKTLIHHLINIPFY